MTRRDASTVSARHAAKFGNSDSFLVLCQSQEFGLVIRFEQRPKGTPASSTRKFSFDKALAECELFCSRFSTEGKRDR